MAEENTEKMASLKDIMKFFEENSTKFSSEWKALEISEKNFFKEEVYKVMNS